MEYLLFALCCFLVALAGGLVGLVLGNVRLPFAVLLASSPATGTGANLVISAAAAGTASAAHISARRVNWRLVAWMAPPSIIGALAGGYLSGVLDPRALLVFIAAVLLYSAWQLFHWTPATGRGAPAPAPAGSSHEGLSVRAAVVTGAAIGLLGGLVGLILGSLRMPALLRFVGEGPQRAVGTNLVVGVLVGIAGAVGHLPAATPDWRLAGVGAASSVPGALLGARLTGRLSPQQLVRAIAAVLVVAGLAMLAQALAPL